MKWCFAFIVCLLPPIAWANRFHPDLETSWNAHKEEFNKTYEDEAEETYRFNVFKSNWDLVRRHNDRYNRGKETYELDLNKYSDLMSAEHNDRLTGFPGIQKKQDNVTIFHGLNAGLSAVPTTVNWTAQLSGVKDQGACGSCWAFSAVAAIEGRYALKHWDIVPLSEQNLVDCTLGAPYLNYGCDGGWMNDAFQYITDNGGIDTLDSYPYRAQTGSSCKYNSTGKAPAVLTGYQNVEKGNENALKIAVAAGPVSVALDASQSSFQLYKSGVYNDNKCSPNRLNHAVLVIGYGVYNGKPYWLIKNSWGSSWGMKGYMMLARNANNKCGVVSAASFPLIL